MFTQFQVFQKIGKVDKNHIKYCILVCFRGLISLYMISDLYQKENLYNHYLPYHDRLDLESDSWFKEIKKNLCRGVLLRDIRPGLTTWFSRYLMNNILFENNQNIYIWGF